MPMDATIIVVEAETSVRKTVCRILEDAGCKVIGLKRGTDALGIIGRSRFNGVITEIRLPDVGGLEILELAKEINPDAAVIIMTDYAGVETAVDAVKHGAYAYFVKPIEPEELKTTIANALKQQRLSLGNKKLVESLQRSRRQLCEANEKLQIDITQRKRAEEALRQSQENLRAYLESAPDGVYLNDLKGTFLYGNKKAEELIGYNREELLGKSFLKLNLLPAKYLAKAGKLLALNAMGKPTGPDEFELIKKDGSRIRVEITTTPVKQAEGKAVVIGFARDITERKQAEEALRESEEKYRRLFELSPIGITTVDMKGVITECNPAVYKEGGYSEDELVGKHFSKIAPVRVRDIPKQMRVFSSIIRGKVPKPFEVAYNRKDGTIGWTEVHVGLLKAGGRKLGVQVLQRDITERKRMDEELIEKTRELEAASQAKSEFLASMSHELRTPLNVIIGFSELMRDQVPGEINEEQRQCLDDILTSGRHLLGLINEVLDLSKVESGKVELSLTNIALSDVLQSLSSAMMPMLTVKAQSLDVEVEEGLPPVYADEARVREVLFNLVSNSAKFTPEGGKLKIEAARKDNWCQVSVSDNGIGIKKEDQEQIFEPFYQVGNSIAGEKKGTGLGLTLAKQIVEMHGGQIWVDSQYGNGSRFIFTLPLVTEDEPYPGGNRR